eukprot:scaffold17710_cov153-Skeletonema_menzelii.AAC.5
MGLLNNRGHLPDSTFSLPLTTLPGHGWYDSTVGITVALFHRPSSCGLGPSFAASIISWQRRY